MNIFRLEALVRQHNGPGNVFCGRVLTFRCVSIILSLDAYSPVGAGGLPGASVMQIHASQDKGTNHRRGIRGALSFVVLGVERHQLPSRKPITLRKKMVYCVFLLLQLKL